MPNIRQYENPINGLSPSDRGATAEAYAGRSIAGSYSSLGRSIGGAISEVGQAYENHQAQQELSKGSADLVTLHDELNKNWNQTASSSDPNDTGVADTWREKALTPAIDKFVEGFKTEKGKLWAQEQANSLRSHMYEKTAADTATIAGDAAVTNLTVLSNRATNIAYDDPTSADAVRGTVNKSVEAMIAANPNLTPSQAAQMRLDLTQKINQNVTMAQYRGMIDKNPDAGLQAVDSDKDNAYLGDSEKEKLRSYGQTVIKSRDAQMKADQVAQKEANRQAVAQASNALTTSLVQPDGTLKVPSDFYSNVVKIASMPDAPEGLAQSLVSFGLAKTRELADGTSIKTDPSTYADFAKRASLPNTDPRVLSQTEILRARAGGLLDDSDFKKFTDDVNKPTKDKSVAKDRDEYVDSLKGFITKSTLFTPDAQGEQKFYEFKKKAESYWAAVDQGKLTEDTARQALREVIPRYQPTKDQGLAAMRDQSGQGLRPLAPVPHSAGPERKPGESAADFLKRTGG